MARKKKPSLQRRQVLKAGLSLAGAAASTSAFAADFVTDAMRTPGKPMSAYGTPSGHEAGVQRIIAPTLSVSPGTGVSRTPLHLLDGTITPSGLHFERHHNGVPDIDATNHRLLIHGLVARPLEFSMADLLRYPRTSKIAFIECAGNSGANGAEQPPQTSAGAIHGLLSCSEWTGVKLGTLLDEAGINDNATWLIAEGGDAASLSRSIPLAQAREEGILALYQNGERLRPEQGYPLRLLMPGWEGNLNIKWLHRIKLTNGPVQAKDETSKYTELQPSGIARQFDLIMGCKSTIVNPSVGLNMSGKGFHEISGIAWSGHGRISMVEVTVDGGAAWTDAELVGPVLPQALCRFRLPWAWDGKPAILQSRATDEKGNIQPTRTALMSQRAPGQIYHYNAIQSWQIASDGKVSNVYA
ncbi:MAG: sulfite dehydrogenase [Betaproteobacteria bacterium]